jgi:photosystem II stability/assembly factor-like uncharacterized protein
MGGSLLQLVAKGMQDVYLLDDPQITLFKIVYRRTTNFSMFDQIITPESHGDFSTAFIHKFDKNADILSNIWLVAELPKINLEKRKPTFEYVSSILSSVGISWNYSPEKSTALATLFCYNGATITDDTSVNVSKYVSTDIDMDLMVSGRRYIDLTKGYVTFGGTRCKIFSGHLVLSSPIVNAHVTQTLNVSSGTISFYDTVLFGDVIPQLSGTVVVTVQNSGLLNEKHVITSINLIAEFTNSIVDTINNKLQTLLDEYNFYVNLKIATKNSNYIINKSVSVFNNINTGSSGIQDLVMLKDLATNMLNGRNFLMYLVQNFMIRYIKSYAHDGPVSFLPIENSPNDIYSVATDSLGTIFKDTQIYSSQFRKSLLKFGILLGAIQNYAYDSLVYNSYGDTATNSDNFTSQPLFGNILTRQNALDWTAVALNATATKLVATANNNKIYIYNGTSWISRESTKNWTGIAVDQTGQILVAIANNSPIYISSDGGSTWTAKDSSRQWTCIASNSVGSQLIAGTSNDKLYISSNGGSTWSAKEFTRNWKSVASNSDGTKLFAVASNNKIFVSTDSGSTWTSKDSVREWVSIASDSTGTNLVAAVSGGQIYLSTNSGSTWSATESSRNWSAVATNSTGTNLVALENGGQIYVSTNSGLTWVARESTRYWSSVASSADATMLIASTSNGYGQIYKSIDYGTNWTVSDANDQSSLVKFRLYTSDDIKSLFYITFINNITRLKIVTNVGDMVDFNPKYVTVLKPSTLNISSDNLNSLDPDNTAIDEVILFYHTIDSDITKYFVYQYNKGESTSVYFDSNIGNNYTLYNKFNDVIKINRGSYTQTDSYKIYRSYMQDVISNDIVNNTIKSEQQVSLIANILKYNIDSNIIYNFDQVINNVSVLSKASRTQADHYIISFYKAFLSTSGTFTTSAGASFTPVIDSSSTLLKDNFKTIINSIVNIQVPDGVSITNYYNNYIQTQIKIFVTLCQGLLRSVNYDAYMSDYNIWQRLLIGANTAILSAYAIGKSASSGLPTPDATVFGRIAFMNYIPLLVAKDIPKLLYDTFSSIAGQVMIDIGADTTSNSIHLNELLTTIDLRDNDGIDGSNIFYSDETIETKKEIYNRLINALFVTTYSGTSVSTIDNASYFSELQAEKGSGNYFLLSCAIRPETFFNEYSTQNIDGSGELVNSSLDVTDLKYLPIEWLTQTYYKIFTTKINKYIDTLSISLDNKLAGKKSLNGITQNIINSFILRNNLPSYADYVSNGYLLLGLNLETNTIYQNYKKKSTSVVTTSSYSDVISSIWYQSQKGFIQLVNQLFNNTLLSKDYYTNNLGNSMGTIYNFIKITIENSGTNQYYSTSNLHGNFLPESILDAFVEIYASEFSASSDPRTDILNYVKELHPAVDTSQSDVGFDFYRLTGLGDLQTIGTNSYKIHTYVKDYSALYSFILDYYNKHKKITLVKNDNDNLLSHNSVLSRKKETYAYDKSSIFIGYLQDHINLKYVNIQSDPIIKSDLNLLNIATSLYWNPDHDDGAGNYVRNSNGVYGVLDALYNTNISGNIVSTLGNISTIPSGQGLSLSSPVNFSLVSNNPMTSFCLHDWYLNFSGYEYLTYQHFKDSKDLLMSILYDSSSAKLITSQVLSKNKNLVKLYSDSNNNIFPSIEYIAWLLFDMVLGCAEINYYLNDLADLPQNISKINNQSVVSNTSNITNYSITLNTLQQLITNYFIKSNSATISQINNITSFKNDKVTQTINSIEQYINSQNNNSNGDINFYKKSINGNYVINTTLEKRLLNLLKHTTPQFAWVKELGHKIAKKMCITIDGNTIETYTPELLHLQHQISKSDEHERGYNILIGNTEEMYTLSDKQRSITTLYIKLPFWFSKNAGNAVPLINLMFSDLTLSGQISDLSELLYIDSDTFLKKKPKLKCKILARYIYLDDEERKKMTESKLEYLIERYNYNGEKTFSQTNIFNVGSNVITLNKNDINLTNIKTNTMINLNVTDPIKYFVWYIKFRDESTAQAVDMLNWASFGYNVRNTDGTMFSIKNIIKSFQINMNGVQREVSHDELFFTYLVPYNRSMSSLNSGEYIYSFALYPLLLQPTGSANFSEISNSSIDIVFTDEIIELLRNNPNLKIKIESWGLAMNILRFISGMAGLVFVKP